MTNPFEEIHNKKASQDKETEKDVENEQQNETLEESIFGDIESIEDSQEVEEEQDIPLFTPPAINTYLLLTYFPIAIACILFIITNPLNINFFSYFTGGIILGFLIRFSLQFSFKKFLTEPYIEKTLYPFLSEIYGELFAKKDLVKLVQNTNLILRKRFIDEDRLKTVSTLKKDGVEYTMVSAVSKDKEVGFAITANGNPIQTASDKYFQNKVHQLIINEFYGFWDPNIEVPAEFVSMTEDGVFTGTVVVDSKETAKEIAEQQESLSGNNIIHLQTRGEKFRFLDTSAKVGLDVMVIMKDDTRFLASAQSLFTEFQKTGSSR